MWQFNTCSFYYPNGILFCPLWQGDKANENTDSIQVFYNRWLGKLVGGVFFTGSSFINQFKLNPFSPTWSSNSQMFISYFSPWVYKGILLGNLCFGTIFSHTFSNKHFNFHYITPWIIWLFLVFPQRLWTRLKPWIFYNSFKLAFQCMPHLSASGHSRMV